VLCRLHQEGAVKHVYNLIKATNKATIQEVLTLLKTHNITSVPIYDSITREWLSFISALDIMGYIAFDIYFKRPTKEAVEFDINMPNLSKPVGDLIELAHHRSGLCHPSATVRQILGLLAEGANRLLVCNDLSDENARLVSQSDVVALILTNFSTVPKKFHQNITQLRLFGHRGTMLQKLVTISSQHSALEGFRRMFRQGVAAVAVVDESGVIVGNLSSSDIRDFDLEHLNDCADMKVITYLKKFNLLREVVACSPTESLEEVIKKLINGKVHRVWVVNLKNIPVGLITMTDVINLFARD